MEYDLETKFNFGRYEGLTLREVYQGTLLIDRFLLRDYLHHILNHNDFNEHALFVNAREIERFDLANETIEVVSEGFITDAGIDKFPLGNLEKELTNYINQHFNPNFLGILDDIGKFMKMNNLSFPIGGDPSYITWAQTKKVVPIILSEDTKNTLKELSVFKLQGIRVVYIGNETYQYAPLIEIEHPENPL